MNGTQGRLVRVGVGILAFLDLMTGLWAVVDPAGWFRDFPGLGRHWIGATPPYNHHLVTDAGAGFLGVGVILLLAALWRERRVIQAALIGSFAHDLPHFLFHLMHPAALLSSADRAATTGGLGFGCLLAAGLLILVSRTAPTPSHVRSGGPPLRSGDEPGRSRIPRPNLGSDHVA